MASAKKHLIIATSARVQLAPLRLLPYKTTTSALLPPQKSGQATPLRFLLEIRRMNAICLRPATENDAAALLDIYRPYIERTAITFEEEVPTVEAFAGRIRTCLRRYPWLVAEVDGRIAGYAYAAPYNERAAYQWACLSSVYLADAFHGRGLARPLYDALFALLRAQGYRSVFALITLPNEPSVRLHERCGFRYFTTFDNIGYKLGHWQEVGWWRLDLGTFTDNVQPPQLFPDFPAEQRDAILAEAQEKTAQALRG